MVVPVLDLLMHKLTFLKGIIVIPVIQTMVTMQTMAIDFLTLAEVVVAMEATMEKEAMLVEEIVVVVVGCQMFSAKFVTNLVVKLPFATIAMKNTMFLHSLWFYENT